MESKKTLTSNERLAMIKNNSPKDLISVFEGLADRLYDLGDIRTNPDIMFRPEVTDHVVSYALENVSTTLESVDYGNDHVQVMESYDDSTPDVSMEMVDVHKHNLTQLIENSIADTRRVAAANQRNLNELTPFDAFLPFTIIRSYLPLIGKDLMPTQTPPQDWIRIKEEKKYIVTKDNKKYLRPDIYNDVDASREILDSARGRRITDKWYPAATEVDSEVGSDFAEDGKYYKLPDKLIIDGLDILLESDGMRDIGDDLDIDIKVNGIRAVVKYEGETHIIEQTNYSAYPDVTSITPQRSVSFDVVLPIMKDGKVVATFKDRVYGDWNAYEKTFNLSSLRGYVRQVQFDGHMSNKNNYEYFSFTNEFSVYEHPIPEGYKSQVPITKEDMDIYNRTGSIDIVATSINEMTEIFTQLEDNSIVNKVNREYAKWQGKGEGEHPFEHFHGNIVFEKEVDVTNDGTRLLKRNEILQDEIQYKMARFIGDIRNVMKAEPFRLVGFVHPNIASLFVGDNIDWKVTPSASSQGIRMDYNMGIYTANGDSFRILTSQKFKEEDGVRWLIFPLNEQNFLSWKHFKFSMFFSRDYRNPQMQLVPNVMGYSRFHTQSYVPLQARMLITNWNV